MDGTTPTLLDRIWPGHPTTWPDARERVLPVLLNIVRMTTVGVLSYLLTLLFTDGPVDLTGALTALLVLQASASGSFRMGIVRVGAVLTGIGIALVISLWVGLTWWSLGLVIGLALLAARVFRLGDQALETPISGMLILAAASQGIAAETRVITTLIGTTVGMVFPLLFPPAIPVRSAAAAVRRAASALAGVLRRSSEYVDENPVTKAGVDRGIDGVRRVTADIGKASEAITQIRDLRRWNTRAIGKADVAPLLDTGLESLQSCAALTRVALQTIRQEAPEQTVADDAFGEEVRKVFAVVLTDLAECVESFGVLLEAETAGREEEVRAQFATNVNLLNETRAMLTELMLVSPEETDAWMLRGTILQAIDEVLHTLDAGTRDQIREDWRWTQAGLELGSTVVGPAIPNPLDRMALRRMQRRAALLRQRSLNVDADFGNEDTTQTLPVISPITPTDPREG